MERRAAAVNPEELAANSHWLWLVAGVILLGAEMLAPGVYLLWIGIAAVITGLLAPALTLPAELAAFAGLAVATTYAGKRVYAARPVATEDPLLNDRGSRLIGEVVTALEPIGEATGRVRVGDSVWRARGGPAAPGDQVRVVDVDATTLVVAPLPR